MSAMLSESYRVQLSTTTCLSELFGLHPPVVACQGMAGTTAAAALSLVRWQLATADTPSQGELHGSDQASTGCRCCQAGLVYKAERSQSVAAIA
jgi:hypothetical protein